LYIVFKSSCLLAETWHTWLRPIIQPPGHPLKEAAAMQLYSHTHTHTLTPSYKQDMLHPQHWP